MCCSDSHTHSWKGGLLTGVRQVPFCCSDEVHCMGSILQNQRYLYDKISHSCIKVAIGLAVGV